MCLAISDSCVLPGTSSMPGLCSVPCTAVVTSGHYPSACPEGRAAWRPHRLPIAQHWLPPPALPAPITTASYSRCSRSAAPAWARRAAAGAGERSQPRSQRAAQPLPDPAQCPAAIAPQRPAMAAPGRLDFASTAELFPGLPGTRRARGGQDSGTDAASQGLQEPVQDRGTH